MNAYRTPAQMPAALLSIVVTAGMLLGIHSIAQYEARSAEQVVAEQAATLAANAKATESKRRG